MRRAVIVAIGFIALAAGGCDILTALTGGAGLPCRDDQACASGLRCIDESCKLPAVDATTVDAAADATRIDGAPADHPVLDQAAVPDQQRPDAMANDAWQRDAATADAHGRDAGIPDTRIPDHIGADTSTPDTSTPDIRYPDASAADAATSDASGSDAATSDAGGCWYHSGWSVRWPLAIAQATAPLQEFPLLVRLDCNAIECVRFGVDGQDLRFTDAACHLLPHEIERWDAAGTSIVWVRIPLIAQVSPGAIIQMYGSFTGGVAPAPLDPQGVWQGGHQGVYHLDGRAADSSPLGNDGTTHGTTAATGMIGQAVQFTSGDWIALADAQPLLRNTGGATLSAWVQLETAGLNHTQDLISISVAATNPTSVSRANLSLDATDRLQTYVRRLDSDSAFAAAFGDALPAGTFAHVAQCIRYDAATVEMYLNGALVDTSSMVPPLSAGLTANTNSRNSALGSQDNGSGNYFSGRLDEVRIESVARPPEWIEMSFRSQMPGRNVVVVGPLEVR